MTSTTDFAGRVTTYSYNANGWRTGETWVSGSYRATYSYDSAGNMTAASDSNSTQTFTYYNNNQLKNSAISYPGVAGMGTVSLTYSYDNSGNRTSLTDNATGSGTISYTYNGNNQLTDLNFSASSATGDVTLSYGSNSAVSQMVMSDIGDAITAAYSYGTNTIGITYTDSALINLLPAFNYTLNSLGQVTQATGPAGSSFTTGTLTYAYDAAGEVASVTGAETYTYSFDSNGNRNSTGYTTGTGNQMTHDGSSDTFTYDHNGNLSTKTDGSLNVWTYTWDYRNRLTQVVEKSSGGTTIVNEQLTYDVFNNLIGVSATVSGSTTQHWTVYDGKNPYIDFNGTGTLTTRYLTDPQALDRFYARVSSGGTIGWYLTDLDGSIREIVDGNGNAKDQLNYDPFGNILYESSSSDGDRFKLDGGAYDSNLTLYRFGDRWQDPVNGKFVSQDPAGFSARDSNLYRFTNNDRVNFADPTGDTPSVVALFNGIASILVGLLTNGPQVLDTENLLTETVDSAILVEPSAEALGSESEDPIILAAETPTASRGAAPGGYATDPGAYRGVTRRTYEIANTST